MATSWDMFYKRLFMEWFREHGIAIVTEMEVMPQSRTIDAAAVCEPDDVTRLAQDTPFEFFRRHNLLEFKSPNDLLNEDDYNLIISRVLSYVVQARASRPDALVCIFNPKKPVALMKRLAEFVQFERVRMGITWARMRLCVICL
jgi:hypothetical protein